VRSPLEDVADAEIRRVVVERWALEVERLRHLPVGGGAHHWLAAAADGRRWFVTCDDVDTKPWLGTDRPTASANLGVAYRTAGELARIGCAFVVAPIAAVDGSVVVPLDDRYCVSVCDHVEGRAGQWGSPLPPSAIVDVVTMLAALHRSAPEAAELAPRRVGVPGRAAFEVVLGELDRPWDGGPLAEQARQTLGRSQDVIGTWLNGLDAASAHIGDASGAAVVTHGEPHPGNLLSTAKGWRLVDWDTVAFSQPERDMWMFDEADGGARDLYRRLTGTALDPDALAAYRLSWALTDLAAFSAQLHDEHRGHADDEHALDSIRRILSGAEPRPYATRAV
jgi:spectinomycin phosphotransferase